MNHTDNRLLEYTVEPVYHISLQANNPRRRAEVLLVINVIANGRKDASLRDQDKVKLELPAGL